MHRLSRISATLTGRKSEADGTSSTNGESFPRPNVLPIAHDDALEDKQLNTKPDEEWFELLSVTQSAGPSSPHVVTFDADGRCTPDSVERKSQPETEKSPGNADADKALVQSDPAADIEIMEQSLISLLDDFRSGRMNALSEERLNQMRKARKNMEELTAFHVRLHRQQVPNQLSSSESECLDEQYDALFRRLDELHSSMRIMSFGDVLTERTARSNSSLSTNEAIT